MERYFVVNTTDNDTIAKNAEVALFVSTIEDEATAKNAKIPDQLDERKRKSRRPSVVPHLESR